MLTVYASCFYMFHGSDDLEQAGEAQKRGRETFRRLRVCNIYVINGEENIQDTWLLPEILQE